MTDNPWEAATPDPPKAPLSRLPARIEVKRNESTIIKGWRWRIVTDDRLIVSSGISAFPTQHMAVDDALQYLLLYRKGAYDATSGWQEPTVPIGKWQKVRKALRIPTNKDNPT